MVGRDPTISHDIDHETVTFLMMPELLLDQMLLLMSV